MSKPCEGIAIVPTKGVKLLAPTKVVGRYVPPSERVKKEPTLTTDEMNSDKLFPSLGGATWPQIRERMAQPVSMLDKVKLSMEESEKEPETDLSKMTDEQVEAAGWWRRRWPARRTRLDEP